MRQSYLGLGRTLSGISSLSRSSISAASSLPLPRSIISVEAEPQPWSLLRQSRQFRRSPLSLSSAHAGGSDEIHLEEGCDYNGEKHLEEGCDFNDEIHLEGCDYNHWLIDMHFPKQKQLTLAEMVCAFEETCARGLNISVEQAKKRIYACSTTTYTGFQVVMTEEESENFNGLPGVQLVLPDAYIDPKNKEYGGDKYIDGTIIPRSTPIQYRRLTRKDCESKLVPEPTKTRSARKNTAKSAG
ncbi:hypothetical protein PanWU01x14_164200 [Parasponia andersonii]|uniref:MORF/ORRM1/DAG-like MORF domain-containing protein n=1 Tax=Parasponia andersonii TaxID=3476 RepID=A0A2P5CD22_PARAD|nr:hypothetical protein PanWU01x14_164200 [Parasponia andersonii]